MERGADWSACEGLISAWSFCLLLERECSIWGYFNLSLSSLFILSLPPKLVWINQIPRHLHVVICSVADLSKITKSPGKFHNFWNFYFYLQSWIFYTMPSHFVAIGRIGQSFITLSQLVKFSHETSWGEKLIQCQAELKWLREIEGGKALGGK